MFFGYLIRPSATFGFSPSLSSELQDTSSVESVEIEFVPDFEGPLESINFSPTDVFSLQHDCDLFLLNQEIDTPPENLNHQDTCVCEKQGQDDFLIHATHLSHNFALPQFMAQHNCEDLKPTDTTSTFSAFTQASSDHTSNQKFVLITQWQPSAINTSTSPL